MVEDDKAVRNLITTTLDTQGYQYHTASTGSASILETASGQADVMILDLGLPDMDGVDIIKKVRGWSNMPIIVVSARSEDKDKIECPGRWRGRLPDQAIQRRRAVGKAEGCASPLQYDFTVSAGIHSDLKTET